MTATATDTEVLVTQEKDIRALLEPLGRSPAVVFVYGLLDHHVYDANGSAGSLWGFRRHEFVGRSDGVGRLWVNPLDWQQHGDLLREQGACVALTTKLRGWDGRLTRCSITSLRLVVDTEPVVLCYVRPVAGSDGQAIHADDLATMMALLKTAAADRIGERARALLLSPSTVPPATVH